MVCVCVYKLTHTHTEALSLVFFLFVEVCEGGALQEVPLRKASGVAWWSTKQRQRSLSSTQSASARTPPITALALGPPHTGTQPLATTGGQSGANGLPPDCCRIRAHHGPHFYLLQTSLNGKTWLPSCWSPSSLRRWNQTSLDCLTISSRGSYFLRYLVALVCIQGSSTVFGDVSTGGRP